MRRFVEEDTGPGVVWLMIIVDEVNGQAGFHGVCCAIEVCALAPGCEIQTHTYVNFMKERQGSERLSERDYSYLNAVFICRL